MDKEESVRELEARIRQLNDALDLALLVIDSYEIDIRNSEESCGVNLKAAGFCQGRLYIKAQENIRKKAGQ